MLPHNSKQGRQGLEGTRDSTQRQSEWEYSTLQVQTEAEHRTFTRFAQRLVQSIGSVPNDPEKKFGTERLKALGATVYEGSTDPTNAKAGLNLLEKYFRVMDSPEVRKG